MSHLHGDDANAYEDDFDEHLITEFISPLSSSSSLLHTKTQQRAAELAASLTLISGELAKRLDAATVLSSRPNTGAVRSSSRNTRGSQNEVNAAPAARPLTSDSSRNTRQSSDLFLSLDIANTEPSLKSQYDLYWNALEASEMEAAAGEVREKEKNNAKGGKAEAEVDWEEQQQVESSQQQQQRSHPIHRQRPASSYATTPASSSSTASKAAADTKHLARLKAKIAATKGSGTTTTATSSSATKQEQGWNEAFGYDREVPQTKPIATHERPSVVKANAALKEFMATTQGGGVNTAGTRGTTPATGLRSALSSTTAISSNRSALASAGSSSSSSSSSSSITPQNAKPLPLQPTNILDPQRVRAIVQTRMPSIVLEKLAATRAKAKRGGSATGSGINAQGKKGRTMSSGKLSMTVGLQQQNNKKEIIIVCADEDAEDSEARPIGSPSSRSAATTGQKSRTASRQTSMASLHPGTSTAAPTAQAAKQPPPALPRPRAASAGVKPVAERAAIIQHANAIASATASSSSQPSAGGVEMKSLPLTQWLRLQKELDELRKRVTQLEAENVVLRASQSNLNTQSPERRTSSGSMKKKTTTAVTPSKLNAASLTKPSSPSKSSKSSTSNLKPLSLTTEEKSPSTTASSPRARCAVNDCGANRVVGKPYCSVHYVAHPNSPSPSPPAASNTKPKLNPFSLTLGGGESTKQFDYDYESDENYGGTDNEDDDGETSRVENHEEDEEKVAADDDNGDDDDDDWDEGGLSMASVSNSLHIPRSSVVPPLVAGLKLGGVSSSSSGSESARNDGMTARASVATTETGGSTQRQSSRTPASDSSSSHSSRLTDLLSGSSTNRGIVSTLADSAATPKQLLRTVQPISVAGVSSLEHLRSSPYSGIDDYNGSFEITQSGTFKRGAFSINKYGMSVTGGDGGKNEVTGGDEKVEVNNNAKSSRSALAPTSSRSHRSGASSSSSPIKHLPSSSPTSTSSFSLNVSDLYTLGVLGRGSSGVVYRSFHAPTLSLVAVKQISIHEQDKRKQLTQELHTLMLLQNPNTIGFHGAYYDDQHIYIVLEYMNQGSLDGLYAISDNGVLSEKEIAYIFEQVLHGLHHLHSHHIVHRDIKPENILYNDQGRFKLSDYGIISNLKSRQEEVDLQEAKTFIGTLLYMSPERINGSTYSYSCDIWSIGLTILTCRLGHFGIKHDSHWQLVNQIQSGEKVLDAYSSSQLSDLLRDLLSHCLRTNPLERPTAEQCLHHPFFVKYRTEGVKNSIPIPQDFPMLRPNTGSGSSSSTPSYSPSSSASSGLSEKELKRQKKSEETEKKNERHMIEQICKLIVMRGMTSSAPTIDPQVCQKITDRLVKLLEVPASLVRSILMEAHQKYATKT